MAGTIARHGAAQTQCQRSSSKGCHRSGHVHSHRHLSSLQRPELSLAAYGPAQRNDGRTGRLSSALRRLWPVGAPRRHVRGKRGTGWRTDPAFCADRCQAGPGTRSENLVNRTYTDDPDHDYGPTRTQQRRDALAVLAFATQVSELPQSKLARADLPEDVLREIDNLRRITSHIARKRQLGFLAKVMRRHEDEVFDTVRALMGENREQQRKETAAMHRLEALRDRLIADDDALQGLIDQHPNID